MEEPERLKQTEAMEVEKKADPDIPERAEWGSPVEFILSCLNYAVGLGNVWRFPYLVYRNGGGAFLIPYIIMLFTMGLPIFYLELIVGQFSGLGPNTAFLRMAPLFHGLGYCALAVITMITIYYMVIVAWTIFYTYESFAPVLAWGQCDNEFNTPACFSQNENAICIKDAVDGNISSYFTYYNQSCVSVIDVCASVVMEVNTKTECIDPTTNVTLHIRKILKQVLASEEYYNDYAMGIRGATWENWGILRWEMVLCLFIAWVFCYLVMIKGVQSMGKVVYVTSVFPYIVLTALLIRGATLPGAYDGIMFYITPDFSQLANASVWLNAASQTFYALGISCGSLITLASYNKFNNNCHRDALFVGIVNMLTSVYAGFAIFSILGFMAYSLGVPVNEVVQDGPGLAFIAYPEAVNQMPLPQLWSVLFFLMLFILGLGSQFAGVEAIATAIIDHWPWLRKWNYIVTACICFGCFILALPMCCQGGIFLFSLMDWNTASWAILVIGFMEIGVVAWVYGIDRFMANIKQMEMILPWFAERYWWLMWIAVGPLFLVGIVIFTFIDYTPASYGAYIFPGWVDALGWMISSASLIPLPILGVYQLVKNDRSDWHKLLVPTSKWGPQSKMKKGTEQAVNPSPTAMQAYDDLSLVNETGDDMKKEPKSDNVFVNNAYENDEIIDNIFSQVNSY